MAPKAKKQEQKASSTKKQKQKQNAPTPRKQTPRQKAPTSRTQPQTTLPAAQRPAKRGPQFVSALEQVTDILENLQKGTTLELHICWGVQTPDIQTVFRRHVQKTQEDTFKDTVKKGNAQGKREYKGAAVVRSRRVRKQRQL